MLIQTAEKSFLTDLSDAITYAINRPSKLKQPVRERFGPGITDHQDGGSGTYRIQVSHWTDGAGEGPTVLVLKIAVATGDSVEKQAFKKHPLAGKSEDLLKKRGARRIQLSEREGTERDEPLTWLVRARWN